MEQAQEPCCNHQVIVDADGDTVCVRCRQVTRVGPLGINGFHYELGIVMPYRLNSWAINNGGIRRSYRRLEFDPDELGKANRYDNHQTLDALSAISA